MTAFARSLVLFLLVGAAALVVAGCQSQPGSSSKEGSKLYDVRGTVVSLDREKKTVNLDHEDIPGLMKAMKMEFSVEDAKVLDGVNAGDQVAGKLKVESGNYVVTSLSKR